MELLEALAALLQAALQGGELRLLLMQGDLALAQGPLERRDALVVVAARLEQAGLRGGRQLGERGLQLLVAAQLGGLQRALGVHLAALGGGLALLEARLALGERRGVDAPLQLEAEVLLDLGVVAFALQGLVEAAAQQLLRGLQIGGDLYPGGLARLGVLGQLLGVLLQRAHPFEGPAQGEAGGVEALDGFDVAQSGLEGFVLVFRHNRGKDRSGMLINQYEIDGIANLAYIAPLRSFGRFSILG